MNDARLWLVVRPTLGIPMILTAGVLGSVAIHAVQAEVQRAIEAAKSVRGR